MIDKIILFPYYVALKLRDKYYSRPGAMPYVPEVPSICVGNVTAGGTGKTPLVEMILDTLLSSEEWYGKNLAVLSRGYKRESSGFQQVSADGSSAMFGDEPLQIKKKFPEVTVIVDKDRVRAAHLMCHPEKLSAGRMAKKCWNRDFPASDYIILDDAFQYRRLKAARTIVLVDYNRPVHKDMLLPFGRLRDLPQRLAQADMIIVTKCPQDISEQEKEAFVSAMGIEGYSAQTCEGTARNGRRQTVLFSYIKYGSARGVYGDMEPRYMYSKKLIMVTGIAKDGPLRAQLSDSYKIVKRFNFPDHHKYRWSDINKICMTLRKHPTASIATTEKDAQRLLDFNGMPREIMDRLFMVPIKTDFVSDAERSLFRDFVVNI